MFILSSPSGTGKTTISHRLLAHDAGLRLSVSATTRPIRGNEVDGRDYHFVDDAQFSAMIADGELMEWAHVFGHRYGTPKAQLKAGLRLGQDFLFDIDWQGHRQLRAKLGLDLVSVFILPPSLRVLEERLRARAGDEEAEIERRMRMAQAEISHWSDFDHVVINDDLNETIAAVRAILHAARLATARQVGLQGFVGGLV